MKHIGLQVSEKDINLFYKNILNGKINQSFVLKQYLANTIFNIKKSVKVIHVECEDVEFELFVHDNTCLDTFQHICLQRKDAREIYNNALVNGYWTYIHIRNNKETYFIRDNSNNIFELKNL